MKHDATDSDVRALEQGHAVQDIEEVFFKVFSVLAATTPESSEAFRRKVERRIAHWVARNEGQGSRPLAAEVLSETVNVAGAALGLNK